MFGIFPKGMGRYNYVIIRIGRARPRGLDPLDWSEMKRHTFLFAAAMFAAAWFATTSAAESPSEPIRPLPRVVEVDAAKAALGERLFHDRRLSTDNTVSCASCHDLRRGGVDRLPRSIGIQGREGAVNAPTVFNSRVNFRQFWDGRAADLLEQAGGPVHNPKEMGSNWSEVIAKLNGDARFRRDFLGVYPQGIDAETLSDAIAAFEGSLITPDAPFDRWLRGEEQALSAEAREGYRLFKGYGCTACHQGMGVGGNMYQKFGLFGDYFSDRGADHGGADDADMGRYNVTGREEDRHYFKVPSLRNVALTPPYFHDGSTLTLDEAVVIMGRYQLGRELPSRDVERIVAFLHSLTGTFRGEPL